MIGARQSAKGLLGLVTMVGLMLATAASAQDAAPSKESLRAIYPGQSYSPYAGRSFPTWPLWGDTHVHTSYSMDAGAFGARLDMKDAYRFARGEELVSSTGIRVRLARPLDFLVVADHSDNMGFFPRLNAGDPEMLADETGRRWYDLIQKGGDDAVGVALDVIARFSDGTFPPALASLPGSPAYGDAWSDAIEAAEGANAPGHFSAFIGYEWTSNTAGNNLHRVVMYRDGGDKASMMEPYTTLPPAGSDNPRDLWKWLARYQDKTGGRVLAIPHNGNLSNGIMFPLVDSFTGKKLDRAYAESRRKWEPVYEVTQIKGDGEAHPFLSPDDEFADYETWDKANLTMTVPKKDEMLQYEYARSALGIGFQLEKRLGVNPYQFGMIGSTDTHTGLATADEDNFFGKHSGTEPNAHRPTHVVAKFGDAVILGWEQAASGYAAVWAEENTRESIFDAIMRREVYATTGPRIYLRLFAGWDFEAADAQSRNPAAIGYGKGVPMGGELHAAPRGKAPSFLVAALRDPVGANLDRAQIIKGWIDKKGKLHEKVYDVALSDGRKADAQGSVPPVGNTVDVAKATWSNTIGDSELITVWRDPDFDPAQPAFYYLRAIEIPTPRWTAYDAKYYGLELADEIPMVTQERAYSSPIWYTP